MAAVPQVLVPRVAPCSLLMRCGVVTRCCGLFQARSPLRSVVCGDGNCPDEGGFHAVGHGCCLATSAAMFLQSRPLLLRTELCRRSFRRQLDGEGIVIRHSGWKVLFACHL